MGGVKNVWQKGGRTVQLILQILLALHVFLTLVYVWDWYQDFGRIQEALIRLALCLFLPLVGLLFWKLVDYFLKKVPDAQMDELYLGHGEYLDELNLLRPVNREEELAKVPAVDTLRTGEYNFRRKMVMDTLKEEDTVSYLSVLKEALANEDAETSHYASTVIMDLQKRIQTSLLEKQRALDAHPDDRQRQEELEQELLRVIESGAFDGSSMTRYYVQYEQVSDMLLGREEVQAQWLHNRITVDMQRGELLHAKETASRFIDQFPDQEQAVVDMIQVCLQTQDRETLDRLFHRLGEMPVILTSRSLQYIRYLNGSEGAE